MHRFILLAMIGPLLIASGAAQAGDPHADGPQFTVAVGNHALSDYAGAGHDLVAFGNGAQIPDGVSNYINLGGILCWHEKRLVGCAASPLTPKWFRDAAGPIEPPPLGDDPRLVLYVLKLIGATFMHEDDPQSAQALKAIGDDLISGNHSLAIGECAGPPPGTD